MASAYNKNMNAKKSYFSKHKIRTEWHHLFCQMLTRKLRRKGQMRVNCTHLNDSYWHYLSLHKSSALGWSEDKSSNSARDVAQCSRTKHTFMKSYQNNSKLNIHTFDNVTTWHVVNVNSSTQCTELSLTFKVAVCYLKLRKCQQ